MTNRTPEDARLNPIPGDRWECPDGAAEVVEVNADGDVLCRWTDGSLSYAHDYIWSKVRADGRYIPAPLARRD